MNGVGDDHRQLASEFVLQPNAPFLRHLDEVGQLFHDVVYVDRFRFVTAVAGKGEKLIGQLRQSKGAVLYLGDFVEHMRRWGRKLAQDETRMPQYSRKDVVEVVGHPAGEHGQAFQLP